jgi:hypothetical protein
MQPANAVDAQTAPAEVENGTLVNQERDAVAAKKPTVTTLAGLGARDDFGTRADAARTVGVDLGTAKADLVREAVGLGARAGVDVGAAVDLGAAIGAVDVGIALGGVVTSDVQASLDVGGTLDLGAKLDLGGGLDFRDTLYVDDTLDLGGALELDVDLDAGEPAETGDETTAPGLLPVLPPGVLGRP